MTSTRKPLKNWLVALIALAALAMLGLLALTAISGLSPRRLARISLDTTLRVLDSGRVRSYSQGDYTNLIFLHQSTGANLIQEGQLRERLAGSGLADAGLALWDQGYNYLRLIDPQGNKTRYSYSVPDDQTDPTGMAGIFSQREYRLPLNTLSGLLQHEVIILKSCFDPTSRMESDEQLEEYMAAYRTIQQRMAQHPEKLFIVLTQPPLNPAETNAEQAGRARQLAAYLMSDDFKGGLKNVAVFDFYDRLAAPEGSGPEANMLRAEFRNGGDSHPNSVANEEIAPELAAFLLQEIAEFRATTAD